MPERPPTVTDVFSTMLGTRRILLTMIAFLLAGCALGVLLALSGLPIIVVLLIALGSQLLVVAVLLLMTTKELRRNDPAGGGS